MKRVIIIAILAIVTNVAFADEYKTPKMFVKAGKLQISGTTGWLYGTLDQDGKGIPANHSPIFSRYNAAGDHVDLTLNVNQNAMLGKEPVDATVAVYLADSTRAYVDLYCGGADPKDLGVQFYGNEIVDDKIEFSVLILNNGKCSFYAQNESATKIAASREMKTRSNAVENIEIATAAEAIK